MGLAVVAGSVFLMKGNSDFNQEREQASRYIAMREYEPVGNGGALAAWNGRISPERIEMYDRIISKEYLLNNAVPGREVIGHYRILTDPSLNEAEKKDKLEELHYSFGNRSNALF